MSSMLLGLLIGGLFGAALYLGGLANPDKIIGTLRLKDFHAMRTIGVFVLVGMGGTWILSLFGAANFDVKPAATVAVLLGGGLLGIGFGMTGYCPGTGLACAASGRLDALVSVIGMFFGALFFIFIYPTIVAPIDQVLNFGKVMLPDITGIPRTLWVIVLLAIGTATLILTRDKTSQQNS